MVRFYIVRHGQTLLNSLDRAQGWADSPLTEAGKQMAADIGHKLSGVDFDAIPPICAGAIKQSGEGKERISLPDYI